MLFSFKFNKNISRLENTVIFGNLRINNSDHIEALPVLNGQNLKEQKFFNENGSRYVFNGLKKPDENQ